MRRNIWIFAAVVVLGGLAIFQQLRHDQPAAARSADDKPKTGYSAPAFDLPDLADKQVHAGGEKDKLTLLNFWASWCGPCDLEAPDLQALHNKYRDILDIYGVNATSFDREREARAFVDEKELTFPILMDRKGDVVSLYKVAQFPTSLLLDRHGIVRERITGVITRREWESLIDKWSKQ
jgi:cytochrome c biogenesis protein CcmG, thiol:disulfide interchange protein DsbE